MKLNFNDPESYQEPLPEELIEQNKHCEKDNACIGIGDILEAVPAFLFWGYLIYTVGWQNFLLLIIDFFIVGVVIFFFLFLLQLALVDKPYVE